MPLLPAIDKMTGLQVLLSRCVVNSGGTSVLGGVVGENFAETFTLCVSTFYKEKRENDALGWQIWKSPRR